MATSSFYRGKNMYAQDFNYDGTSLSSINSDFIVVAFEVNDPDPAHQRTINQSGITNDNYVKHYYGHIADTALSFDITIARCSEDHISKSDAQTLSDWLFAHSDPRVLYLVPRNGDHVMYENTDFIGSFTSMQFNGDHNALTFHFENISGYAFTKPQTYTIATLDNNGVYTITPNGSKTGEVVYPTILVRPNATGTLSITMRGTDQFLVDMTDGVNFYIRDCGLYREDGSLYSFDNLHSFNWPYLIDGENVWTFTGDATLEVTARYLITTGL
jgi:hypothetical protein